MLVLRYTAALSISTPTKRRQCLFQCDSLVILEKGPRRHALYAIQCRLYARRLRKTSRTQQIPNYLLSLRDAGTEGTRNRVSILISRSEEDIGEPVSYAATET
jgi:hypothetical protein